MAQNPPQSDFPLTLAEVLYEEIKIAGVLTSAKDLFKTVEDGIKRFPDVVQVQVFDKSEIPAPNILATRLLNQDDQVAKALRDLLTPEQLIELAKLSQENEDRAASQSREQSLIVLLNELLRSSILYEEFRSSGLISKPPTELNEIELIRCNRSVLEKAYPKLIKRFSQDEAWRRKLEHSTTLVREVYEASRQLPNKRSALCLSGGGIRSAIFNLGVLQGLAGCGLLGKFDYLSTVSGGGYIASWLTRWIHREGPEKVLDELKRPPKSPLEPEPEPVYNLRVFSNFLTPKTGALSPDTWTMIATYLRNLFLNGLVFVPAIMTFLMLPRLWSGIVNFALRHATHPGLTLNHGPGLPRMLGILGLGFGLISLAVITFNLPSVLDRNWRLTVILLSCVLPLVLMAACLSLYWVIVKEDTQPVNGFLASISSVLAGHRPSWHVFVIVGAVVPGLPQLGLSFWKLVKLPKKRLADAANLLFATALVAGGGALTGALTYVLAGVGLLSGFLDPDRYLLYVSLSVPFLLCIFMVGGTFVAGFSSRFSGSEDQEWWARSGAWFLIAVLLCGLFSLLVSFGPSLLVDLHLLLNGGMGPIKSTLTSIVGVISGAISLFGGFSSKTKGSGQADEPDVKAKVFGMITSIAAAIFVLYIAIVLIWLTDWVLFGLADTLRMVRLGVGMLITTPELQLLGHKFGVHVSHLPNQPVDHRTFLTGSPWWFNLLATTMLLLATLALGWCINTNRFSLHYWWRNRMMRSFLGTTCDEQERDKTKSQFTDYDANDNVPMHELKHSRPFHVIDATLNLVGSDKLEWQDRKAESFTMSPLHCGSYWLGYRSSREYGGREGISLATAASISGAAASPNMGYMMTSSVVRIIMTLFNVRLGFWLGNPGPAGEKTYKLDSPRESVRPIVEEALGLTDDKKPYIYLSDGGHFENLGLYEMILRRCRFIVVCDATTDTDYEYEAMAMAIRQIRVDFGVPIDIGETKFNRDPKAENNYCALGLIRYSCVDKPPGSQTTEAEYDGVLVYIKPSLLGDEPRDVLNYHATSDTFPQESAADQWFSEAQFESYRELGRHMIATICGARPMSLPDETASDLDKSIREVIKTLGPLNEGPSDCGQYAGFGERAQGHIGRPRPSAVKAS